MYINLATIHANIGTGNLLAALESAWSRATPRELDELARQIAAHAEEFAGLCAEVSTLAVLRKLSADAPLSTTERARLGLLAVSRCRWIKDQARDLLEIDAQDATHDATTTEEGE